MTEQSKVEQWMRNAAQEIDTTVVHGITREVLEKWAQIIAVHASTPALTPDRAREYYEVWRKKQSPDWIETPRPDAWWFNFAADFARSSGAGSQETR